jgi:hypothetical protein
MAGLLYFHRNPLSAVIKGRGIGDFNYIHDPLVVEKCSEIHFCIKLRIA